MSQLEPLIADLALILICAGVMTLLFKSLKQPIVLGYIVAGFLASPNMPYMPSVTDGHSVHVWSDIGVIFLLFALGLEFSFKKILTKYTFVKFEKLGMSDRGFVPLNTLTSLSFILGNLTSEISVLILRHSSIICVI